MDTLIANIFTRLDKRQWMIATAESCTGGLIAAAITDVAGSSAYFDRGFITYSNDAKIRMLGVPADLIATHGAVSKPVAKAMADGAIAHSNAQVSIAVTGIAGPGGGSATKPVGLIYIAIGMVGGASQVFEHRFNGDRASIRQGTVSAALMHACEALS